MCITAMNMARKEHVIFTNAKRNCLLKSMRHGIIDNRIGVLGSTPGSGRSPFESESDVPVILSGTGAGEGAGDSSFFIGESKRKAAPKDGLSPSARLTIPPRYSPAEAQPASACHKASIRNLQRNMAGRIKGGLPNER